jgi:hypothetical protein
MDCATLTVFLCELYLQKLRVEYVPLTLPPLRRCLILHPTSWFIRGRSPCGTYTQYDTNVTTETVIPDPLVSSGRCPCEQFPATLSGRARHSASHLPPRDSTDTRAAQPSTCITDLRAMWNRVYPSRHGDNGIGRMAVGLGLDLRQSAPRSAHTSVTALVFGLQAIEHRDENFL